jgi:type IV pilus biogenesis protein CpaD/CtpE
MPDYRAYIVGSDGRFQGFEIIDAADDEAAVRAAKSSLTAMTSKCGNWIER